VFDRASTGRRDVHGHFAGAALSGGPGVDNVSEQRKLEATLREMIETAAQHSLHWTLCWTAVYIRGLIIRDISWHFAWAIILSSEKGYKSLTAHTTDSTAVPCGCWTIAGSNP